MSKAEEFQKLLCDVNSNSIHSIDLSPFVKYGLPLSPLSLTSLEIDSIFNTECITLPMGRLAYYSGSPSSFYYLDKSFKYKIKILDIKTRECVGIIEYEQSYGRVNRLAALPNDQLAGRFENKIMIWDIKSGQRIKTLSGGDSSDSLIDMVVLADGTLASISSDNTVRMWNLESGLCEHVFKHPVYYQEYAATVPLVILPSGYIVHAGVEKGSWFWQKKYLIQVWDIKNEKYIKTWDGHRDIITAFCALSDGLLASSSYDGTVKIWNIESGQCLQTLVHPVKYQSMSGMLLKTSRVSNLILLSNGLLASTTFNIECKDILALWDIKKGVCLQTIVVDKGYPHPFVEMASNALKLLGGDYSPSKSLIFDPDRILIMRVLSEGRLATIHFKSDDEDRLHRRLWTLSGKIKEETLIALADALESNQSVTKIYWGIDVVLVPLGLRQRINSYIARNEESQNSKCSAMTAAPCCATTSNKSTAERRIGVLLGQMGMRSRKKQIQGLQPAPSIPLTHEDAKLEFKNGF